jgi:putative addiction module component (TIGR02574 family)
MTHAEIIVELPKLSAEERQQLIDKLCELQEADLIAGKSSLQDWEKKLLDEAWAAHQKDPSAAIPWEDVMAELRGAKGGIKIR